MSEIKLIKHQNKAEKDETKCLPNLPCSTIFTKNVKNGSIYIGTTC